MGAQDGKGLCPLMSEQRGWVMTLGLKWLFGDNPEAFWGPFCCGPAAKLGGEALSCRVEAS